MPCSSAAAICAGTSRRASSPPWTRGCSVLTRPSIISGKPVRSSIGRTGTPASESALAVPPVETISTPNSSASARQNSTTPVLSVTDTRARLITGWDTETTSWEMRARGGGGVIVAETEAGRTSRFAAAKYASGWPDAARTHGGRQRTSRPSRYADGVRCRIIRSMIATSSALRVRFDPARRDPERSSERRTSSRVPAVRPERQAPHSTVRFIGHSPRPAPVRVRRPPALQRHDAGGRPCRSHRRPEVV